MPSVLSLEDAKAYLKIQGGDFDADLQDTIDAAEAIITHHVGPLQPTTVTAVIRGGGDELGLPVLPVISVTSITPYGGSALSLTGLNPDLESGVLSYFYGNNTPFVTADYTVVYQAGRADVPADLLMAVRRLVKHLWEPRRGPTRRPGAEAADGSSSAEAPYALPRRVEELLAPYRTVPIAIG